MPKQKVSKMPKQNSGKFKFSNKLTEPNLELASVYKVCFAPRSFRRTKGPIYALDTYSNNVVMFNGPDDSNNSTNDVHLDHNNNEETENENVVEVKNEHIDEMTAKVMTLLANFKTLDPTKHKELTEHPQFSNNFHDKQCLPAIENYERFLKDPEGCGIENLTRGQFENVPQEDGSVISFPVDPLPVIFPLHIQIRENARRVEQETREENIRRYQEWKKESKIGKMMQQMEDMIKPYHEVYRRSRNFM